MKKKLSLAGLLPDELKKSLENIPGMEKLPAYRAKQICGWINGGTGSFDEMKNLPLQTRALLEENFSVYSSAVNAALKDDDGTVKLQITLHDKQKIEAVILRDGKNRKTACLSVQAGCACKCAFCKTGQLGFKRNLDYKEIAEEFLHIKNVDGEKENPVTHIVFMGMGEALLNLENVRKAVDFFCDGLNISKRRITLSTCGITEGINRLTEEGPDIRLALSLVTANETLRKNLMPVTAFYPLAEVKKSLIYHQKKRKRRITFEMVLLKGINTSEKDAAEAAEFASGLEVIFNLIPWNPVDGIMYEKPSRVEAENFAKLLEAKGQKVTMRYGKGSGIAGACGQLG